MIIEAIKEAWNDWVVPREAEKEKEEPIYRDFPTGTLRITTPDGKTTVSMDIVTAADERKAQQLTALLLGGTRYEVVDADNFLGLTD